MPVDVGGDRVYDFIDEGLVLGVFPEFLLSLLIHLPVGVLILDPLDVVGLDDGREDGQPMADVEPHGVLIHVDANQVDLVPRPGHIDVIAQQHHLLLPGNTPGRHLVRRLLYGHHLVVPVHRAGLVDQEGPIGLAARALAQSDVLDVVEVVHVEVLLELAAPVAPERDLFQLAVDYGAFGDHAGDVDQLVQVDVTQVAQLVLDRHRLDLDEDLGVHFLEGRVDAAGDVVRYCV